MLMKGSSEYGICQYSQYRVNQKQTPIIMLSLNEWLSPDLALYIRLIEVKHEYRTVRLNEEIALNIGLDEKFVGIEILDATEVLGQGRLPDVTLENIPLAAAV